MTPDDQPQFIVGTSGMADAMILNTPFRDFNSWVCHRLPVPQLAPGYTWDCASFGGGDNFNITILNSYLQTHRSQIVFSQIIVNQNVTLDYHVNAPTNVTIVMVNMASGISRVYWQSTTRHDTVTYPLLAYSERPGTVLSLPGISQILIATGIASLIVAFIQFKTNSPPKSKSYQGSSMQKCPGCGGENLFFAEKKCLHCGSPLHAETPRAIAQ